MTENKDNKYAPQVTPYMYKAVSEYRRGKLEGEVQEGSYRDGSGRNVNGSGLTPLSNAVNGGTDMSKYGQSFDNSGTLHHTNLATEATARQEEFRDPQTWL